MLFRQYLKENQFFSKKEDNPIIYTLVIAKLANKTKEELKEDETLLEVIKKAEKLSKDVNSKILKDMYSPIALFGVFDNKIAKQNIKDYVNQYFEEFEQNIANSEKKFEDAYKIHTIFKEFKESEEFKNYLKSL